MVIYQHQLSEQTEEVQEFANGRPAMTKELMSTNTVTKPQKDIEFLESLGFECRPKERRRRRGAGLLRRNNSKEAPPKQQETQRETSRASTSSSTTNRSSRCFSI
jgi:hypothetical protein